MFCISGGFILCFAGAWNQRHNPCAIVSHNRSHMRWTPSNKMNIEMRMRKTPLAKPERV